MTNELSPTELAKRLEAIETRLAYQEHWLDTLDGAVAQQERRLEKLETMSNLMRQRLREQHQALAGYGEQDAHRPQDDVPPHY